MAQYGSVRVTPTFGEGNATRAAPLQTEPTRTLSRRQSLLCDRGIIINTHSTRQVFLDNGKKYFEDNVPCFAQFCRPSWTSYIVALCSLCAFFFFLGFINPTRGNATRNRAGLTLTTELMRAGSEAYPAVEMHHYIAVSTTKSLPK